MNLEPLDTYIVCDRCGAHEVPGLAVPMEVAPLSFDPVVFYCAECALRVAEWAGADSADDEGF